jgi:hypothetical protein
MRLKALLMAAMVCAFMGMTATALAQSGTVKKPKVEAETLTETESQPAFFQSGTDSGSTSGGGTSVLPFSGADVTLFLIIGVSAIAVGAVLVRRGAPKGTS